MWLIPRARKSIIRKHKEVSDERYRVLNIRSDLSRFTILNFLESEAPKTIDSKKSPNEIKYSFVK